MEYNYTQEFKQPNKIYAIGGHAIPFAANGLRLEYIVVGGLCVLLLGIVLVISFITGISFLQSLFINYWMLLLAGVGVLVWTLFSLKWDNKSFLDYLIGRGTYLQKKNKRYEHELLVPFYKQKVTYQVTKHRNIVW